MPSKLLARLLLFLIASTPSKVCRRSNRGALGGRKRQLHVIGMEHQRGSRQLAVNADTPWLTRRRLYEASRC